MEYEPVIGLEVHVQLRTRSKMFTRVPYRFAEDPNTLCDMLIFALPGALPVMNRGAIEQSIRVGLMFQCEIAAECKWDRKHYFYPDSPKGYQISQYDQPICRGGEVEIELQGAAPNVMGPHRKVRLTRIHLEEDVGKLTHFEGDSLVDYNRSGAPLIEIVTEPDLYSPEEAFAFLTALKQSLVSAGVSDCDMEKGQLRCDANISIRPQGAEKLGTKVELKNLNSITGVRNGLEYEIRRQKQVLRDGGRLVQETRRWDAERAVTTSMRGKEEAHDYRYFPDPDLMPVRIDTEWKEGLAATLPEAPFDRQRRYLKDFDLPFTVTSVLCPNLPLCRFFEAAVGEFSRPRAIANFIVNDLLREMASGEGETMTPVEAISLRPKQLADLVRLVEEDVISNQMAKELFPEIYADGLDPKDLVESRGLRQASDADALEELCRRAIDANEKAAIQFKQGNEKAINAIKGQVMKETRGKANPKMVDGLVRKLLS